MLAGFLCSQAGWRVKQTLSPLGFKRVRVLYTETLLANITAIQQAAGLRRPSHDPTWVLLLPLFATLRCFLQEPWTCLTSCDNPKGGFGGRCSYWDTAHQPVSMPTGSSVACVEKQRDSWEVFMSYSFIIITLTNYVISCVRLSLLYEAGEQQTVVMSAVLLAACCMLCISLYCGVLSLCYETQCGLS